MRVNGQIREEQLSLRYNLSNGSGVESGTFYFPGIYRCIHILNLPGMIQKAVILLQQKSTQVNDQSRKELKAIAKVNSTQLFSLMIPSSVTSIIKEVPFCKQLAKNVRYQKLPWTKFFTLFTLTFYSFF